MRTARQAHMVVAIVQGHMRLYQRSSSQRGYHQCQHYSRAPRATIPRHNSDIGAQPPILGKLPLTYYCYSHWSMTCLPENRRRRHDHDRHPVALTLCNTTKAATGFAIHSPISASNSIDSSLAANALRPTTCSTAFQPLDLLLPSITWSPCGAVAWADYIISPSPSSLPLLLSFSLPRCVKNVLLERH